MKQILECKNSILRKKCFLLIILEEKFIFQLRLCQFYKWYNNILEEFNVFI